MAKITLRKFHKYISLLIAIQLLLWTVSGIYFSFNKIENVRGEQYLIAEVEASIADKPKVEKLEGHKLSVKISADLGRVGGSQEVKNRDILNKLKIKEPKDTILLVRKDPDTITATNTLCSHNGCTIAYNKKQKSLDCPCHGGRFNLDGSVKIGPPNVPLRTVSTGIEGDRVIFWGEAKR